MGEAKRRKVNDPNYGRKRLDDPVFNKEVEHLLRYVNQDKAQIEDIAFLELCNDVIALLDYADGKEKAIALAIIEKYREDGVRGNNMNYYHYVDLAIKSKREGGFSESVDYYNKFFQESCVGKAWLMTYYGLAKTLTAAGEYKFALVAIKISIELASITGYADADYIYSNHYLKILNLHEKGSNEQYLREISGHYEDS